MAGLLNRSGQSIAEFMTTFDMNKWSWESSSEDLSYVHIATVISVLFQNLANIESVRLLCLLSYLEAANIPEILWTEGGNITHDAALQPLLDFALVTRSSETRDLSVPRSVQTIVRDAIDGVSRGVEDLNLASQVKLMKRLSPNEKKSTYWVTKVIDLLHKAFHNNVLGWDRSCELIKPHAFRCIELSETYGMENNIPLAGIYYELADYLSDFCGQIEAIELFQRCFEIYGHSNHPRTADVALNLGNCYGNCWQFREALTWYEKAMKYSSVGAAIGQTS